MLLSLVLRRTLFLLLAGHSFTQQWNIQENLEGLDFSLKVVGVREKRQAENSDNNKPNGRMKRYVNDFMADRKDTRGNEQSDGKNLPEHDEEESDDNFQTRDMSSAGVNHVYDSGGWYGSDLDNEGMDPNESSNGLFNNEEQTGYSVDDKYEPSEPSESKSVDDDDVNQMHSEKLIPEDNYAGVAMNSNEMSRGLLDKEQSRDSEKDKIKLSERNSVGDNDSKQMYSEKPIPEQDNLNEATNGSETSNSLLDEDEETGDSENDRQEPLKSKSFADNRHAKQVNSKYPIPEQDHLHEAINGSDTSSYLLDDEEEEESGDSKIDKGDTFESKSAGDNRDAKQVYSKKPISEHDHLKEVVNTNETSSYLLDEEEESGDSENDKEEPLKSKYEGNNDAEQVHSKKPIPEENHGDNALNSNEMSSSLLDEDEESGDSENGKEEPLKSKYEGNNDAEQVHSKKPIPEENHGDNALNSNEMSSSLLDEDEESGDSENGKEEPSKSKPVEDNGVKQVHSGNPIPQQDHIHKKMNGNETSSNLLDKEEESGDSKNDKEGMFESKFVSDNDAEQVHYKKPIPEENHGDKAMNSTEMSSNLLDEEGGSGDNENDKEEPLKSNSVDDNDAEQVHSKNLISEQDHLVETIKGNEMSSHLLDEEEEMSRDSEDDKDKSLKSKYADDIVAKKVHFENPIPEQDHPNEVVNSNETSSSFLDEEEESRDSENDKQKPLKSKFVADSNAKKVHSKGGEPISKQDDLHEDMNGIETSSNLLDEDEESGESENEKQEPLKPKSVGNNDAIKVPSKKPMNNNETSNNLFDDGEQRSRDIEDDGHKPSETKSVGENDRKQVHSKKTVSIDDHSRLSLLASKKEENKQHQTGNAWGGDKIQDAKESDDRREKEGESRDSWMERYPYDEEDEDEYDEPVKRQNLGMEVT